MAFQKQVHQVFAALVASCGGFIFGNMYGLFFSILVQQMQYSALGIKPRDRNSIIICGAALSTIPIALFPGRIGRKSTMLRTSIMLSLVWFILALSERFNIKTITFLTYLFCGFFSGIYCIVSPVYIVEIADRHLRNRLVTCFQLFIFLGIFYTVILAKMIRPKDNTDKFFTIIINFSLMPAIMSISLNFIPESPFYLIAEKKELGRIFNAFKYLRGEDYDPTEVIREIQGYFNGLETIAIANNTKTIQRRIRVTPTIRAFYICMFLISTHDIFGLFMIWSLVSHISTKLSFTDWSIILLIFGPLIFGTIIAMGLLTCVGKRRMLLLSYGFMTIFSTIIVACSLLPKSYSVMYTIPSLCIVFMEIAYTFGAAPLTWLLVCDILPPDIRCFVGSICVFIMWFLNFLFIRFHSLIYFYFGQLSIFCICSTFNLSSFLAVALFIADKSNY